MIEGKSFGDLIALIESLLGSMEHPALAPFFAGCPGLLQQSRLERRRSA